MSDNTWELWLALTIALWFAAWAVYEIAVRVPQWLSRALSNAEGRRRQAEEYERQREEHDRRIARTAAFLATNCYYPPVRRIDNGD